MNQLERLITEVVHRVLDEGRCTVDEVADQAIAQYGDLIDAEAKALVYKQIKSIVRRLLRDLSDNEDDPDAEQALPGLKLPTTIAVKRADGVYEYLRADQAVWEDLQAGLVEREQNIVRATIKRDQFRSEMDRLRPWMADDASCTVADALRRERASASA